MPSILLASQSPYRRAQLEQLGIAFEAFKPLVDEELLKVDGPSDLVELTRYLALHKAESLRARFKDAVIVGSDQLAEIDGERLDKPGTRDRAIAQLEKLQGRAHRLITSLVVSAPTQIQTFTDITTIRLRSLTRAEIEAYVGLDQPLDCAGSYKIEKAGIALVESLESKDPSAIQGLPLISLGHALRTLGYDWAGLWQNGRRK
jgi:septum formation protein